MKLFARRRARRSGDHRANELRARIATTAALVIGLVAVVVAHEGTDDTIAERLLAAVGEALVVAGLLGLTVDVFFKRELVRDAFEAGFGYLLPDRMRPEVRWLVGQELLCLDYDQHFKLTELGDRVRLDIDLTRRVANVGPHKFHYEPKVIVDEWFETLSTSEIDVLEVFRGNELLDTLEDNPRLLERTGVTVTATLPKIWLAPGEELLVHWRGHEIKTRNDSYCQTIQVPVSCPVICVDACDGITADVRFGNRGEVAKLGNRWLLKTTLLPHQVIALRWWETWRAGTANGHRPALWPKAARAAR
jgi:hypothetical protein